MRNRDDAAFKRMMNAEVFAQQHKAEEQLRNRVVEKERFRSTTLFEKGLRSQGDLYRMKGIMSGKGVAAGGAHRHSAGSAQGGGRGEKATAGTVGSVETLGHDEGFEVVMVSGGLKDAGDIDLHALRSATYVLTAAPSYVSAYRLQPRSSTTPAAVAKAKADPAAVVTEAKSSTPPRY